ncbi:laccase-1 [Aplysia californica]|uniref:Laccase-1 n=1 Tax=Aplysia californica TaxID=6500 RepID=A0ABM1AB04_APLCA|nr:laccase-1 [Aplysia californica]
MMTSSTYSWLTLGLLVLAWSTSTVLSQDHMYTLPDYKDHPCVRQCENKAPPRLCKYHWVLEVYYVLSKACFNCPFNQSDCSRPHCVPADGVSRGIRTANRMLPGPGIQVCEGDTVEVTVDNRMEASEGTSIHWHGILQNGTGHMDGVAMVTQCPVTSHSKFVYRFKAVNPGTHFWHAHAGFQRSDGLFGSLVVRRPPDLEPHLHLYDYDLPEHVLIVNDWMFDMTINRFAAHHHDGGQNKPDSMLINGQGRYEQFPGDNGTLHYTPRAEFKVKPNHKYRFRVISNGILNCPVQVSVDDHTMMIIASDGNSFQPFVADSFNIFAGERYDFVLYADKVSPLRNYWIRVRGMAACKVNYAHQTAILRYEGAPLEDPPESTTWQEAFRGGIKLNPWNSKGTDTLVEVSRMISTDPDDDTMTSEPDRKIYLAMDFNKIDNDRFNKPGLYPFSAVAKNKHLYSPQINHITSVLPSSPPLSQFDDVPEDAYCNAESVQTNCDLDFCSCVHRYQVSLGDLVELVVIDEGVTFNSNHPMHLHGYNFRVVAIEKLNTSTSLEEVKAMDARGEINRTTSRAPLKDTVTVPDGGYTIIRFRADNPGVWFFHCHIEFHSEIGMGLLFQVGTKDQMPKTPKNFPRCGNWKFSGYDDDEDDKDERDAQDDDDEKPNDKTPSCPNSGEAPSPVPVSRVFAFLTFVLIVVKHLGLDHAAQ